MMTGQVRVPGVRVQQFDARRGVHHLEVDGERLDGGVGVGEGAGNHMRGGVRPWLAEAVDVDRDLLAELRGEVLDVDAGPSVDVRWPLARKHSDVHDASLEVLGAWRHRAVEMRLG